MDLGQHVNQMKKNHHYTLALFVMVGVLAASSSRAATLFSQPFNTTGNFYSTPGPGYPSIYDDFTLVGGGTISTVQWSGINPGNNITGFTINILSDNSGKPGTTLNTTTITGTAGQVASGSSNGPYSIYNYSADLTTPSNASAGTEYFIQIGAGPIGGTFYWETSSTGNDGAFSGSSALNQNLAFTLEGTSTVPEPPAAMLGLLGGATFIFRGFAQKS
jgi:hypothetical protein